MRAAGCAAILLIWLSSLPVQCKAGPADDRRPRAAARQLLGAWRLVAIEYSGPGGGTEDPYYQAGSSGILIYDPSGWMSVHITAPNRRSWVAPAVRVPPAREENATLKAEAFDTYYAYYGTWDYDAAASTVTHHVKSSVIPAEAGSDYTQTVSLEGARLIFTVQSGTGDARTVRKKVWQRIPVAGSGF